MRMLDVVLVVLLGASMACSHTTRAPGAAASATDTRIWAGDGPDFPTGDISPDGRFLTDINWGSGNLDVIDLGTGEVLAIAGRDPQGGGYAWTSAFSTDGRRLALSRYLNREDSHELRVVNRDGTDSRVLIPADAGHFFVEPVDWSPSDEEILVAVRGRSPSWQLVLVSSRDGARRIVKEFGWQAPGGRHDQGYPHAKLSPDGRFVAYDYPSTGGEPGHDIFAVEVGTGATTALVAGPGSDRFLDWLPDGRGILFYSDRDGEPGVWRVQVRNGTATQAPELVRARVYGLNPLGFTTLGYAYGVYTEAEQVHIAVIDPVSGMVREPPQAVADTVLRASSAADWSPDGTRLAYVTHDPLPDPTEALVIRGETGEVARRILLTPAVHSNNGTLRWVSEDRVLLYGVQEGQEGVHTIDLRNGTVRRQTVPESVALKWFEAGPEGRTLYFVGAPGPGRRENQLLAFDVETGARRVLGEARVISNTLAVSPDGSELAYLARRDDAVLELRTMSTGSGSTRALHGVPGGRMSAPVAWAPDGSRVLVAVTGETGVPSLWSVGVRGGEPVRLLAGCCEARDVRIDRQGRRIAFAAGADRGEVRLLKQY